MVGQDTELEAVSTGDSGQRRALGGLARRSLLSLVGSAVSAVMSFVLIVVVTRGFDQEVAGAIFSTTSLFVILESLCALGTATGLVYFLPRLRARGQNAEVPALLRTALVPVAAVATAVAITLAATAPWSASLLVEERPELARILLQTMAIFLPLAVCHDVVMAATQGYHTMTPMVVLERVGRPVLQVLLVLVCVALAMPALMGVGWFAAYAVTLAAGAWWLSRLVRSDRDVPVPAEPEPVARRAFWGYTSVRGVAAAAQIGMQRLDVVLVAYYLGAAPAAVYTAATRFVVLGQLGSQAVAQAVQPMFSDLLARDDIAGTRQVYRVSTAWIISVTWPIHLTVAVLAPVLLLAFGEGYGDGRTTMIVLAGAMLVATGCGMVTMLLLMAGNSAANLFNVVAALSVNIALDVLLIPRWGIDGAAVAWAVALVVANLLPLWQVHRQLGVTPFGREAGTAVAVVLVAYLPAVAGAVVGASAVALVILTVLSGFLLLAGLWFARGTLHLDQLMTARRRRRGAVT